MEIGLTFLCVIIPAFSQFGNCYWGEFSLQGAQGYEIQCIDNDFGYGYTPCMSYTICNGQRYQSIYFNRNTGQCQFYLAEWDDGATIPQYSISNNITQYTFNYANGQITAQCPQGIEFEIVWSCDPLSNPFSLVTTCGQINECKHTMGIKSVYACTEAPPDDDCMWGNFDLQAVRGYEIQCMDNVNDQYAYAYTPCMSYALCNGVRYQAAYFNRVIGQCEYYLSQWDNGELQPVYFNDGDNPLWQFDYNNGEQTTECPGGIEFEVNWICDPGCTPFCLKSECNQSSECRHQIKIHSSLACVIPSDDDFKGKNKSDAAVDKILTRK